LVNLEKLYFQDVSGNNANPVCKMDDYREEIFSLVPSIETLDGIMKGYEVIYCYLLFFIKCRLYIMLIII
jgi:hypothetical protein